jgi:hypothetical protein
MTREERTALHEAAHCAAAIAKGVPVWTVDVTTRYERTGSEGLRVIYGEVRYRDEWITDRETARKRMIVTLMGPLEAAEEWDEVPKWPLDPNAATRDEQNLAMLADFLGLDERGYNEIFREAIEFADNRIYRLLLVSLAGLLDYWPRLGPDEIRAAIGVVIDREE